MTKFPLSVAALTSLLLAGCATMVEESSQTINFQAVGATEVLCDVDSGKLKYHVRPPQTIVVKKSKRDLTLTCMAAGNRMQTMTVPSSLSGWTFGNVVGGAVIPGTLYDGESGAMFKYPEVVVIDFSETVAHVADLPAYHAVDTIDPAYAGNVEDIGHSAMKMPGDDATMLRRKMAQLQYERDTAAEEAMDAEREARRSNLEGGWTGDKGGPSAGIGGYSNAPDLVTPSAAQPPVSTGTPQDLPQPVFPSTTSF